MKYAELRRRLAAAEAEVQTYRRFEDVAFAQGRSVLVETMRVVKLRPRWEPKQYVETADAIVRQAVKRELALAIAQSAAVVIWEENDGPDRAIIGDVRVVLPAKKEGT